MTFEIQSRIHKIEGSFEDNEEWLQRYLAKHPELLPTTDLDGINSKLRLIGRELDEIDLLFINDRGLITIVETKLFKNEEARRKVVAQLLDYAAQLNKMDVSQLCQKIASLSGNKSIEGLEELEKLVNLFNKYKQAEDFEERFKAILAHFVVNDDLDASSEQSKDEQVFLQKLGSMLDDGSFRLVIVTDKANEKLLDLLNYTNSMMRRGSQLVAFELSPQKIDNYYCFIPHLIGTPGLLNAEYYRKEVGRRGSELGEEEFFALVKERNLSSDELAAIHKLYDFSKQNLDLHMGEGSFIVIFKKMHPTRAFYHIWPNGNMVLNTPFLFANPDTQKSGVEFKNELSRIGFKFGQDFEKETQKFSIKIWSPIVGQFIEEVHKLMNS